METGRNTESLKKLSYDYEHQAWIVEGRYQDCAHPPEMNCQCYGRQHALETAIITPNCH